MRGLAAQDPDAEWYPLNALKSQVLQIYPAFKESDYDTAGFGKLVGRFHSHIELNNHPAHALNLR